MKTLKLLLLLFVPFYAKSQTIQYLGTNNNIVEVRNAFNLPKDSVGIGNIRLKDTTLQYKVGSNWRVFGSGGGGASVDSSNFQKISNKVTTLTNSTTQYPSTSAIRDSIYTKSFTYTKAQTDSAIAAGDYLSKNDSNTLTLLGGNTFGQNSVVTIIFQ